MAADVAAVDLEIDPVGGIAAGLAGQAAARLDAAEARCLAFRAKALQALGELPARRARLAPDADVNALPAGDAGRTSSPCWLQACS